MIWGGDDVVILEIKCWINVMCLNRLKPSSHPQWKKLSLINLWTLKLEFHITSVCQEIVFWQTHRHRYQTCVCHGGLGEGWTGFAAAVAAKSLQSCPTLCDPKDGSPPGFPIPGILQARTLEWVASSFSNAWKWKVKGKSLSRVWLLVTPWTAAH